MKVDYQKTIIYKLCCKDPNITEIYVGHSTDYKSRNQRHRYNSNNTNQYIYRFIRETGGYENWSMIKLYNFPCDSKREAEAEECKIMIELNATLNTYKPFTTEEEKKQYNKEYRKKYHENNKDILNQISKEYYKNNIEEIKEKKKETIICELCNCVILKKGLIPHQKTKKCIKLRMNYN